MTESVLNELVGEGKKFSDAEALAKGKKDADAFIESLQNETKDLRDIATGLGTENEQLKQKLEFYQKLNGKAAPTGTGTEAKGPVTNQGKTLTAEDVSALMIERENQQRAAANQAQVDEVLVKQFGAEAKKFVADKAVELGLSVEELVKIAGRSPSAFFNTVGISPNGTKGNLNLNSNSRGGPGGGDTGAGEIRNAAYWAKKRQEMGHWKFATNKDLTLQMHKDMVELGDKW